MKVLEVAYLRPNKFGSFEKYSLGFGVYLRARGHQHHTIYQQAACETLQQEVAATGGSISAANYRKLGLFNSLRLIHYIRRHRIDVVHLHFYPVFSLFSLLGRFLSCRIFYSYRLSGDLSNNSLPVKLLKRLRSRVLGSGIQAVFCVSGFARRKFIHNYQAQPARVHVVHNGLNWQYFAPAQANEAPQDCLRLICVAALIPEKGVEDVIRALALLQQDEAAPGRPLQLQIVGEGAEAQHLQRLVSELSLERCIEFLGSRNDVPQLLQAAHIALVPSRWNEAFGFTVIEAMAAGLPVIASTVGGIPEIIEHGRTGLLVEPARPQAIAEAVRQLQQDPILAADMGRQAQQKVQDYFNVERVYRQQLQFYQSATAGDRAARSATAAAGWIPANYGSRSGFITTWQHRLLAYLGRYRSFRHIDWARVERLVFVCKGNICRSAYAEFIARRLGVEAISCGIDTIENAPANAQAMAVAATRGIDMQTHSTQPLMYTSLRHSDLIVMMEPWQARFVSDNLSRRHQLTLLGLWFSPARPHLQDPYACSDAYFESCFSLIEDGVQELVERLTAQRAQPQSHRQAQPVSRLPIQEGRQ